MTTKVQSTVLRICREHANDRTRLVDIARAVQAEFGCVGVRPVRKLGRGGRYLVVHELTRGGELTVRRAVFRCE